MKILYSPEYAIASDLETVSKSRLTARMLEKVRIRGIEVFSSKTLTRDELLQLHDAAYVHSVLSGSTCRLSAGNRSPERLRSIFSQRAPCGTPYTRRSGKVARGCPASGVHHAKRNRGFALRTINGTALAAIEALEHVKSVGILDLDALHLDAIRAFAEAR